MGEAGDRFREDPIGSDAPRGKDTSQRRSRFDPGLTPTEQAQKNRLMRQFMRTGEGPGAPSAAFRASPIWCEACGYYFRVDGQTLCRRCGGAS